jgi:O-antigen/teichoic acid export membrane protein
VALLAGAAGLGQGIAVLAAPLLTRLYSPADFGLLAVYASILSAIIGLAALRYHLAIPVAEDDEMVANLLVLCLLILVGMTAIFGIVLWLVGDTLLGWVQAEELAKYLWLLPLSFLGAGLYQVLSTWAIRNNHFGLLARTRLGQGAGLVITQLGLGVLRVIPAGLLIGDAVGRACGGLSLLRVAWREQAPFRRSVTLDRMWSLVSRYRRFPLLTGPASLLASVRAQVPTLLLASFYGSQIVGWFGLGQRLLTVTFFLIATSVGDVYLNEASRLTRERPGGLMSLYWQTLRRSTIVVLPLLTVMALAAPWVFGPLFGPEWAEAGRYVQVLVVPSFFDFLCRSVGSTLGVLERQDLWLLIGAVEISLAVGSLVTGGVLGASPLVTLTLFAVASSLGGIINLGLTWYAIRHSLETREPGPAADQPHSSTDK